MNRCGTCKYWGSERDEKLIASGEFPKDLKFRQCIAIIHDERYLSDPDGRYCEDNPADEQYYEPIESREHLTKEEKEKLMFIRDQAKAVTLDGSGYRATLRTREDFACRLYEPKDI